MEITSEELKRELMEFQTWRQAHPEDARKSDKRFRRYFELVDSDPELKQILDELLGPNVEISPKEAETLVEATIQ